jgi:hypothetical protein
MTALLAALSVTPSVSTVVVQWVENFGWTIALTAVTVASRNEGQEFGVEFARVGR